MARKHRATGKPKGGKRAGAGRHKGESNALPLGWVGAIKSLKRHLPEDAPKDARKLDERTFQRMCDVMEERVFFKDAPNVLKVSMALRDELHGAQAQKTEHSFSDMTDEQLRARYRALTEKAEAVLKGET